MPRIYLASPLGFSPEYRSYLERVKARLDQLSYEVFDPWEEPFGKLHDEASRIKDYVERIEAYRLIAAKMGKFNATGIEDSDMLLGILDGAEVDSGTASEIGYAAGLGKRCYGLRTDRRDCGDHAGLPINLQVLFFIEQSGGKLFRSIEEIEFD